MTSLHFFSIPALNPEPFQATLNQFLAQHRVVSVEKQWLAAANHACWAICVTITGGQTELPAALKEPLPKPARETRIDYRETLSPDDFALYANLRTLRKNIAISEGVPPYALFNNQQLASIACQRPASLDALCSVDGIGAARAGKYGTVFLDAVQGHLASSAAA